MRRPCCLLFGLILLAVVVASCWSLRVASAQTATPTETPTPTPSTMDYIEIGAEGEHFRLERAISYGDIAVAITGMLLLLVAVVYVIFKLVTHYLR